MAAFEEAAPVLTVEVSPKLSKERKIRKKQTKHKNKLILRNKINIIQREP